MNPASLRHSITPPFVHPLTQSTWDVFVHAVHRADGRWNGEIEFIPQDAREAMRRTGVETTQPSDDHVVYWAGGLSRAYFEGAFDRASARIEPAGEANAEAPLASP